MDRKEKDEKSGCLICGSPLIYSSESVMRKCEICGKEKLSNAVCENGHFICDECHEDTGFIDILLESSEKDPSLLLQEVMDRDEVHMHGPEHHIILPCVMLTCYRNCGGKLDLHKAIAEAVKRGRMVPGGACGFLGVCGAAAGAGIYASIVLGTDPLDGSTWNTCQGLTARCLEEIAKIKGPRCCKRTNFISIGIAAAFTSENMGVDIPCGEITCHYYMLNDECIKKRCPFYGGKAYE